MPIKVVRQYISKPFLFCIIWLLGSCSSISHFDHYSYLQATSLKVDGLSLMDHGNETYIQHEKEISAFSVKLQKAYEYDKFRPLNTVSTEMYRILLDPSGNLLGGYFTLWKSQGKLSRAFINEKKDQVSLSFNEIAILESSKIKNK